MLDDQEIRLRIKKLIIERLFLEGLTPEGIGDDDVLFGEGLGLDSVDALELVLGLEQEFGLKIKSKTVGRESFASVAALGDYVKGRLSESQAVEG